MDIETSQEIGSNAKLDPGYHQKQLDLYKKILVGVSSSDVLLEIEKYRKISSFQCAAPIKKEEIYFKCTDCSSQPTHCICESCFFQGNHEGHSYLYFNKLTGGTCDCGDPNLSQLLLCNQHQKTSQEDRLKCEHVVSDQYKLLIQNYFRDAFTAVFSAFENGINEKKDNLTVDSYSVDYFVISFEQEIKKFEDLLEDIKLFISENPSGTLILSKILMELCPKFICHHNCSSIEESQEHFMVVDKDKIEGHPCNCSILKNIFRYIRYYGKKLEYEVELTLNHFFINQEFKLFMIEIFSEMFNFMQYNYSEESKLYRLFYQFNSIACYEKFLQHTYNRGFLFKSFKELQMNKNPGDYKKGHSKILFYYFLLYFFSTNEQNPVVWKNNFDCAVEIIKAICSNGKCSNFGAHFIMTRLIQDYLFFQVIQEVFKSLHELPVEHKEKCFGLILIAMLDLIEEYQMKEREYLLQRQRYYQCAQLEDEIEKLAHEKLDFIDIMELEKIQRNFENFENFRLQNVEQYSVYLEELKIYLQNVSQEKKGESLKKVKNNKGDDAAIDEEEEAEEEEENKNNDEENYMGENELEDSDSNSIDQINMRSILLDQLFNIKRELQNKSNLIIQVLEIENQKRNLMISRWTKKVQWYEINQCPLFNNKYRVVGSIFAQLYIQSESMEVAKQKIFTLIKTYGTQHHVDTFQTRLMYIVEQLSHNLEYIRHHDENIMGYNDYQAISNGLPGVNADKVPIERYYMNSDYNLYDNDILTLQTVLPLTNPKGYINSMLYGMSIMPDNEFAKYDENLSPFEQKSFSPLFKKIIEESIDKKEAVIIKRVRNFMKVLMMIGFDTICQINSLHSYKDIFVKWMKPYLKNALNICFNYNKKLTFQSLKELLASLKMHKAIPVKHSILSIVKLSGDYFERLPNLKFEFEPFDFLRDKKLHNDYYQLLKELSVNNQEIDYIIGNQFESLIAESEFAAEIFNKLSQNSYILSLTYNILSSVEVIRYQRMFQEIIQYSLKYIYCFVQSNKNKNDPVIKERVTHLVLDSSLIKNLQFLKEEKELFKSIEKIEQLLKELRIQIQKERNEQISVEDADIFKSNQMIEEEDDRTIFRKKAKEAQLRQLQIMKQKSERFKEQNMNEVSHQISIEYDKEKHICMYCQDPQSKELQVIQAYIEKDNLDTFSNKKFKIPHNNSFRFIIQSCQHTSHYDCRDKAKLTQRYKLGALAPQYPDETRRKVEGFCMQCRFLFNIGIPFVEQQLRKSIKINKVDLQNDTFSYTSDTTEKIDHLKEQFSKRISLGESQKEQNNESISKNVLLLLNSLCINFDEEDDFSKIKIIIECLVFSLQQVFDQGMFPFFKKTKLIDSNLYLCSKFIIHKIIGKQNADDCQAKLNEIIDYNWELLTSLNKFTEKFFQIDSHQKNDCFNELSDMYVQTCLCIAISEKDDKEAAIKINTLSQLVFYNVVSINSRILILKSFTQNEINHSEIYGSVSPLSNNYSQNSQPIQGHQNQIDSHNIQLNSTLQSDNQLKVKKEYLETYLKNDEYMDSLMGYILPWSNLISCTLITLFQVEGDQELEEFVLSDNRSVDSDIQIYNRQCDIFNYLKITSQMLVSGMIEVDKYINTIKSTQMQQELLTPQNPLQDIQSYEAIKFNLAEIGNDFKDNHQKYFNKRCSLCKSYPHAAKSDLCVCLICEQQMCSITCEQKNIFASDELLKKHIGNLNLHANKHHQGKTIFFNMLENTLILIDSPMIIEFDHLYFDVIKQPMKIDIIDYTSSKNWREYTLDKEKLKSYQNLIIQRQIPNKIRSIIQSSTVPIECRHNIF